MSDPVHAVRAALTGAAFRLRAGDLLAVTGDDRVDLLQRLTSGDLRGIAPGESRPTCVTTARGRLVDRLRVVAREDDLILVATPGLGGRVADWIERFTILEDVETRPLDDEAAALEVVGPRAVDVLSDPLPGNATLSVEGDGCGAGGGRLVVSLRADRPAVVEALEARGAVRLDDAAWRAARVHGGLLRLGEEIAPEEVFPLEIAFGDAVSFDKGCYVGQEVLARLENYDKVRRRLRRVRLERLPAATPVPLLDEKGAEAGRLLVATDLPDRGRPVGLALLRVERGGVGTRLALEEGTGAEVVGAARTAGGKEL